jgi:Leucine-rich repeat (LRR) protein
MRIVILILFLLFSSHISCQDFYNQTSNYYSNKKYPYTIKGLKKWGFTNPFLYNKKDIDLYKDSIHLTDKITSVVINLKKQVNIIEVFNDLKSFKSLKILKFNSSYFAKKNIKQKIFPINLSSLQTLETISFYGNPHWELTLLFNELSQLNNLKNLSFTSFNDSIFLTKNFIGLKRLKAIHYNGGLGPKFPKEISKLKNLETVVLQVNSYPNAYNEFKKIKNISNLSINIYDDKTDELDQLVRNYNSLKRLFISGRINNANQLFKSISKNKKLEELRLQNNKLQELPKSIGDLINLKSFYSSNNKLSGKFIDEFFKLKKLKKLEIQGSNLKYVSNKINNLKNLESMKLYHNRIERLPNNFYGLKKLKRVNLDYNYIFKLPKFSKNNPISYLNLRRNKLTFLDNSITELKSLDSLFLQNNYLKSLPKNINKLHNLKLLDLGNNYLTHLPNYFFNQKKLKELNLSNNLLKELPKKHYELDNIKKISLQNNYLINLPRSICRSPKLEDLKISNNKLTSLPHNFGNLTNLKILDLSNKKNAPLPKSYYTGINYKRDSIKKSNYSENNITYLPSSLSNISSLNFIDFSRNKNINSRQLFELLKKSNSKNYNIYIRESNIKELPTSGWDSINVKTLGLSDNHISSLPKNIIRAKYLTALGLNRNKSINFYVGSQQKLHILFAEKGFISFQDLPETTDMVIAYARTSNSKANKKEYHTAVKYAKKAFSINKNLTHKFLYETDYIEALYHTKNFKEAIRLADIEIKKDTKRGPRILNFIIPNFIHKAKSQLALGDTIKALKTYEVVSKRFNGNKWMEMALIAKNIHKDSLAKSYFNKSFEFYINHLKFRKKDWGYHLSLLEAYIIAGENKKAKNYYNELTNSNFENQNYNYLLKYFDAILSINTNAFNNKYLDLEKELQIKKYNLPNWSFELLLFWNSLFNPSEKKSKIQNLTKLLKPKL